MINRRSLLRGLGLGAAAPLLSPLCHRLVREAYGHHPEHPSVVVVTDGNGWGHQGMARNSELLDTVVRAERDWDLPDVLSAFQPFADEVTIARRFRNFGGLHGSGWATLSGVQGGETPGGISFDRWLAQHLGEGDAFSSIALGVPVRRDRPPACTSADGAAQPFPAFGSPLTAHRALFGTGGSEELAAERSLLDRMAQDIQRVRGNLAPWERQQLDQVLESYRALEVQLELRQAAFATRPPPAEPPDLSSLGAEIVEAHADIIAAALSFGLTHVAHLSILGFDAHNVGWGFLGFPGDAHEQVAHKTRGYDTPRADAAYRAIIDFKARVIARMRHRLAEIPSANGSLADQSLFVWINSGGGKHHHGNNYHPIVTVGRAGGRVNAGRYLQLDGPHISDIFLGWGKALGIPGAESFGTNTHDGPQVPVDV